MKRLVLVLSLAPLTAFAENSQGSGEQTETLELLTWLLSLMPF